MAWGTFCSLLPSPPGWPTSFSPFTCDRRWVFPVASVSGGGETRGRERRGGSGRRGALQKGPGKGGGAHARVRRFRAPLGSRGSFSLPTRQSWSVGQSNSRMFVVRNRGCAWVSHFYPITIGFTRNKAFIPEWRLRAVNRSGISCCTVSVQYDL